MTNTRKRALHVAWADAGDGTAALADATKALADAAAALVDATRTLANATTSLVRVVKCTRGTAG